MSNLVKARWLCAYAVDIPGQGVIAPGDTALISAGEAKHSDHWEPIGPAKDESAKTTKASEKESS